MSSSFHQKTKKFDPLGHASVEGIFDIEGHEKKQAAAAAEQDRLLAEQAAANAAAAERMKTRQVQTRGMEMQQQARAAGATRSGNEQDYLTARAPARRRYAHKDLLGA